MPSTYLFTSESVADGHPDKIADQIADYLLDACLYQDPMSRVALEVAVKSDVLYVFGEMTTNAHIDVTAKTREVLERIGYDDPRWGFDPLKIKTFFNITEQSNEIDKGVSIHDNKIGAGDQGLMFGYACQETPEMMPLPIQISHDLMKQHKKVREDYRHDYDTDSCPFGPDAKTQVTLRYSDRDEPMEIDTIVFSSIHPSMSTRQFHDYLDWCRHFITQTIQGNSYAEMLTGNTRFLINPAGPWTIGGPIADAGLTGRKITVDTYGGAARHGGGSFSGKDPTKVDRTGAYAARHLAKLICKRFELKQTEVQISYAIGVADPVSICATHVPENEVLELINKHSIDLTPSGIIKRFDLRRPIYTPTSTFGHFGRLEFPWEQIP